MTRLDAGCLCLRFLLGLPQGRLKKMKRILDRKSRITSVVSLVRTALVDNPELIYCRTNLYSASPSDRFVQEELELVVSLPNRQT